ncbi:hypothetical protein M917_0016 [Psychrobacter aquaticus CMS 56]|uniref:2-amino-4-hydroxy-6-hydroxymethyldihydropteridine diphosphokinase n=2 Tax=Psychrobacter TaxID=497 RepID=U4TAE4_9GAMM|nr:hypothetical protein M917_0016 [Psychrobacter aquaticus CMS 56]
MHKALAGLNSDTLERYAPEALQAQLVTAVLLALGSNYHAEKYLAIVRERLSTLGEIQQSTAFQNPDFTATPELPKPDYTNQCVYLSLKLPMTLQRLQQTFKQFECECHRQRLTEQSMSIKQVTMDIDILLISLYITTNSLSKNSDSKWIVMNDRYPFKAHEKVGMEELIQRSM